MNRNEEYLELMKELEENTPNLTMCVVRARTRKNRAAFVYRPLAGLAACFALFVLLVNFSAPVAQACAKVPILRQLAEAVTFSKSLQDAVENDYVQQLNLTQEKDGITAKIEYVILDRKQVNIFYRLESEEHTYLYTNPKVLNKEGTREEPCSWTTPINDVPNDQLRLITLDYNEEEVYQILGSSESDIKKNNITNESPVGKALIGRKVGDEVCIDAPGGVVRFKIVEITKAEK